MGSRLIFCQKENKLINKIHGVRLRENVYPSELIKDQIPEEEKYRFINALDIASNKCPNCGGNLYFKYED